MDPQQQQHQAPFTQADKLHANRLQQALSTVRKALDDGDIDEQAYAAVTQQIQQRLQPIMERQKQSDEQALKAQQDMQMKQHAHLQAMEAQARKFRAETFSEGLVTMPDPFTGKVAHFVETSPNQWEKIDFGGGEKSEKPEKSEGDDGP